MLVLVANGVAAAILSPQKVWCCSMAPFGVQKFDHAHLQSEPREQKANSTIVFSYILLTTPQTKMGVATY